MAYITLNKQNFFHNLNICSQQAGDKSKIAIVLKDNAYGHGLVEIAKLASEYWQVLVWKKPTVEFVTRGEFTSILLSLIEKGSITIITNNKNLIMFLWVVTEIICTKVS